MVGEACGWRLKDFAGVNPSAGTAMILCLEENVFGYNFCADN